MGLGIEIIKYVIISFAIVGFKVAKNRLFFVPVLFAALLYAAFNDNDLLALRIVLPLIVIQMIKDIGVKKFI